MKGDGVTVVLAHAHQLEAGDRVRLLGEWELIARVSEASNGRPLFWTDRYGALTERDLPELIAVEPK